ncbi:hypothetical protein QYF36_019933 [Acer negundo]|nr:hypothetical protein QYF36_019933 [Acer negundo]
MSRRVKADNFIDCDDYGVPFVEARVAGDMSELVHIKNPEIDLLQQLLPYKPLDEQMSKTRFNFAAQINYFECGGVAISFCVGHFVADAATAAHFIKSWATVACDCDDDDDLIKEDISLSPPQDFLGLLTSNIDQELLNIMAIPPGGEHESELKEQPYPSSSGRITKRFVFDKSKIIALRETFGSTRVTRFEAMFVLLWSAIQATKSEEDELVASIAVNLRKRMNPPIPEQCFGNICTAIMTNWPKEEITDRNSFAGKLRELIRMVNDDYIRNTLPNSMFFNFIRDHDVASSSNKKRIVLFSGCNNFPFYKADFGWGKPEWLAFPQSFNDHNYVGLFDTSDGEGIEAWIGMSKEEMAKFEQDPTVIAYASLNPSTYM